MRQRDLEWIEGGLIVREATDGGGTLQQQLLDENKGWFLAVERWRWDPQPTSGTPSAPAAKGGASTIPNWVGQAVAASSDKAEAKEGEE